MKAGVFSEEYIAIFCRELLKGLEYLHGEGKLHRDIKGELNVSFEESNYTYRVYRFSCEHPLDLQRRRQASGLRCFQSIDSDDDQKGEQLHGTLGRKGQTDVIEHIRGDTILDESGGHQAVWIQLRSGHLEFGYDHHLYWSRAFADGIGITAIELAVGEPPYADLHPMKASQQEPESRFMGS